MSNICSHNNPSQPHNVLLLLSGALIHGLHIDRAVCNVRYCKIQVCQIELHFFSKMTVCPYLDVSPQQHATSDLHFKNFIIGVCLRKKRPCDHPCGVSKYMVIFPDRSKICVAEGSFITEAV